MPNMTRNMNFVEKGKSIALVPLKQQGRVSEALAIETATEVATTGFTAADQQDFSSKLALLHSEAAEQIERRAQSKANRVTEAKALADAKAFKRTLDTGITDLYSRAKYEPGFSMPVAQENFRVGPLGKLNNSTPKVLEYLDRVRPHVEKVKTQLAPYFGGGDPVVKLDEVSSALRTADTLQERDLEKLPEETLDVYQLKGEVLYLIERLNRAGRLAFDGDAGKASQFNKDILLRARRSGVEVIEGGETEEAAS